MWYTDSGAPRHLRLNTLPRVEHYGDLCVWTGYTDAGLDEAPEILLYDDDVVSCLCGVADCEWLPDDDGDEFVDVCGKCNTLECTNRRHSKTIHGCEYLKVCLVTSDGQYPYQRFREVNEDFEPLAKLPDWYAPPPAEALYTLRRPFEGWVYMVCPNPDLSLHRVKVGWTSKQIEQRLKAYKTVNPNLMLLGLWETWRQGETVAWGVCDGRIRETEVFDTRDPFEAWRTIDHAIAAFNREHAVRLREWSSSASTPAQGPG